tara:strand:- start:390 stop:1325 length:936 start_codon:yes stop_codon:yes gene_type:complete
MALTKIIGSGVEGISNSSNATAITIDSSENVGIGTASPTAVLDVRRGDADGKIAEFHTSTGFGIELGSSQTLAYIQAGSSQALKFETNGANEKMRVTSDGNFLVANTDNSSDSTGIKLRSTGAILQKANGTTCLLLNRGTDDGTIVSIRQADSQEGTISSSGSTISYNGFCGLHESSGIASDTPVGTVCSTIDELDTYPDTQDGADHPKKGKTRADHAKVKVSDSAGDKRIYGVLQRFDPENGNKPMIASVGIGSVLVTGACAGGDLLESNGDGTAKVQSDDIIRSKTIGKVTIGNSSTDVKLVSCVLYCG